MAAWINMPLGMVVGLDPGDFVLDGDPGPSPQKRGGATPHPKFSAYIYCGQTAGYIKVPLVMEVGLSPGDFLLDEDPAAPPQIVGRPPQILGSCLLWPNG